MSKTKTNQQIFADIRERGMMTEQEMKLLLRRSNASGEDVLDYALVEEVGDGYGIPLTKEQGAKALAWLYRQTRKRDKKTGYREDEIILNAQPTDFTLVGFYDTAIYQMRPYFQPVYNLNGMEYRVWGDVIIIVG